MTVLPAGARCVDESLFEGCPENPALVGSRCRACSAVAFPAQGSCARCAGQETTREALPTEGTIWAFTIQGFPPKEPYVEAGGPFRPYGVGYVDLGEVYVESRLLAEDLATLATDLPVTLVLEALPVAGTDEHVVGFAFRPTAEVSAASEGASA